jgi:hypothetical protein
LWNTVCKVFRGKCIVVNEYIRKEGKSKLISGGSSSGN